MKYKIVRKKTFEKEVNFEERLNNMAREGWRAVSITGQGTVVIVLMERDR